MRNVWHRIYSDYLIPSRLDAWDALLRSAVDAGYRTQPLRNHWQLEHREAEQDLERVLLVRHDVDTDPARARQMFSAEQRLGVKSTYYFRLSTVDVALMREIEASGSEASYHFEEIATVAKRYGLKSGAAIAAHMAEIQQLFESNLLSLRQLTRCPMKSVAAHGDFVNRRVAVENHRLLTPSLREKLGIDFEAYDTEAMAGVTSRFSDTSYPWNWENSGIRAAIHRGDRVIYVLAHPRHWGSRPLVNSADNLIRLWQGVRYGLRSRGKAQGASL